jgi:prepilin-type N-terminal cleavage/methylation domain-containing protein
MSINPSIFFKKNFFRGGFTLIETLAVISVVAILSSMLIVYSRSSERNIILLNNKFQILNALHQAKSLSLATFGDSQAPCAYGVYFNKAEKNVIVFHDNPDSANNCPGNNSYDGDVEKVYSFNVDDKIDFSLFTKHVGDFSPADYINIVFIPPDPEIKIIYPINTLVKEGKITLNFREDSSAQASIIFTLSGQIYSE